MTTAIVLPVPLDCLAVSGPAAILCPCVPCLFSLPHFYVSLPVPIVCRPASCSSDCRVGECRSCYDERWATLHKQACKLLAAPPPPGGWRPVETDVLLCLCCVYLLSGNSLHIAQPVCLTWSEFPTGGGAPGLSCHVLPCLP
jgi:hypothetical protein